MNSSAIYSDIFDCYVIHCNSMYDMLCDIYIYIYYVIVSLIYMIYIIINSLPKRIYYTLADYWLIAVYGILVANHYCLFLDDYDVDIRLL